MRGPHVEALLATLRATVRHLRETLPEAEYRRHPTVKLFAAITRIIYEVIPSDRNHPDFRLRGALSRYRRVKGHGLPTRYRLFYIFSSSRKLIIILYVNDDHTLRQEGARSDPYVIFTQLVGQGLIGVDFEGNYDLWKRAQPGA